MSEYVGKTRTLLWRVSLAVVIICIVTALGCGAFLLLRHLGWSSAPSSRSEFTAVGTFCETLLAANERAASERAQGHAGCVCAEEEGFFVIVAVYSSKADAEGVAEKIGGTTYALSMPSPPTDGEDKEVCAEGIAAASEAVRRTETMWRELENGQTSESLSVRLLKAYAEKMSDYAGAGNGVGNLCGRVRLLLDEAAEGGHNPLSADVRHASAAVAVLLHEYASAGQKK